MSKEIRIPGTLKDMTLKQYIDMVDIFKVNDDDSKIDDYIVQYWTGKTIKDIRKMSINNYNTITCTIRALLSEKPELTQIFYIDGIAFAFHNDLKNLTGDEYIDASDYLQNHKFFNNFMAVMYRPIIKTKKLGIFSFYDTKNYDREEYKGTSKWSELMLKSPAHVFVGALVFFWTIKKDLMIASLTSSLRQVERVKVKCHKEKEILMNTMDGIRQSIMQVEEDFSKWKMF